MSDFRKSKMKDGHHLGFRCRAIISVSINILAPNFIPRWKIGSPRGSNVQKSDFRKSKMADGRHLGFRFWAIIRRRSTFLRQIWYSDGNRQPKGSQCSEIRFRFWAVISSSLNIIAPNFVQWWKIYSTKWPIAQKFFGTLRYLKYLFFARY